MSVDSTALLMTSIALASLIVGVALQRIVQLVYLNSTTREVEGEGATTMKPMTYAEAMSSLAKVRDTEPYRRRRKKRRAKPEPVALSMLRYGEYHTDDSKLSIQAWRPDATHRLAGHVVIDIIPKAESTSSVRRLAIDLETVEATKVVQVKDGCCVVLAVRDYEVKGQGVIFKDLEYSKDVGVDDTTLYVVLVVKDSADETRSAAFRKLAKALTASTSPIDDAVLSAPAPPPSSGAAIAPEPAAAADPSGGGGGAAAPGEADPLTAGEWATSPGGRTIHRPDVDVDAFFTHEFARVF